ncbi:MAG: gas vesicle protein [Actinobacteria bacterium]|nr:gas vesicle protein [Actinomycetota bacterium]
MEPSRDTHATLVDLLDRILDKGLVINADIIISVAGIPLIGVNLRAALAGMETMLKYGVMQAWDEKTRAWEREHRKKAIPSLLEGEKILDKMYGSHHYTKGIYTAWQPGYFYLTNKRVFLHRQDFDEIIFQVPLEDIKGIAIKEEEHFVKEKKKQVFYLIDRYGGISRLHPTNPYELKESIEQAIKDIGFSLEEKPVIPHYEKATVDFLREGEEITHQGEKVWYLVPAQGIQGETWRPGHIYLTNKGRLCWRYDFERKLVFDVPVDRIISVTTEIRKTSGLDSNKEKVLDIMYQVNGVSSTKRVASFSGKQIDEWEKVLHELLSKKEESEFCPQCGRIATVKELLEKSCANCGWVSPGLKKKMAQVAK